MKYKIHVWGPKDRAQVPTSAFKVNTTSTSTDFGKAFSPFMNQGPISMFGLTSHNVENFYQSSKVYRQHIGKFRDWIKWRDSLLSDTKAHRYPAGKGAIPEFSWIPGLGKLSNVDSWHKVYVPLYEQKLDLYCRRQIQTLLDILTITDVWLFDFDSRMADQTTEQVFNDTTNKAGHAFVIKKYLEDNYG